jgi:hypothetical protein
VYATVYHAAIEVIHRANRVHSSVRKAAQLSGEKARTGPSVFLESRTATAGPANATSTQLA